MPRWIGLDLNGWRDHAARDWDPDDPDATPGVAVLDGGVGGVAVRDGEGRWIGGPQAILAPHGRGRGWGAVGAAENRRALRDVWRDLTAGDPDAGAPFAAAAEALTRGAERVMLCAPDRPDFAEAAQGRVLSALKASRRPRPMLLWRSVALFLAGLERGLIPKDRPGLRVRVVLHVDDGLEVQVLRLGAADDFPGHLAPEREGFGTVLLPEVGLSTLLAATEREVVRANRVMQEGLLEATRLPVRALCGDAAAGEVEILRHDNGSWVEAMLPHGRSFDLPAMATALPPADLTLFASPLADPRRDAIAAMAAAECQTLVVMQWEDVARGALIAARLMERGLPHYLDRLEPIALAVRHDGDAHFEPLIEANRNVPANREYVSPPMEGFVWGAGQDGVECYILKGASEVRHWRITRDARPAQDAPVTIQLRQTPGQSWARLSVSSSTWEPLARSPEQLDWARLTPDPRTPDEILATLRRPPPVVPVRVAEAPHIGFWNGAFGRQRIEVVSRRDLELVVTGLGRARKAPPEGDPTGPIGTVRPIGTDGAFPAELGSTERERFAHLVAACAAEVVADVTARRTPPDNLGYRCATWAFTQCPAALQDATLDALEAWNTGAWHPLHDLRSPQTVLQHGAGRSTSGEERVARLLRNLAARRVKNAATRAALGFVLTRRLEAPAALTPELVAAIGEHLSDHLADLAERRSFASDFKYCLSAVAGLLRYREVDRQALVADRSAPAGRLSRRLVRCGNRIEHGLAGIPQGATKLGLVRNLVEILAGEGGDRNIIELIDRLDD